MGLVKEPHVVKLSGALYYGASTNHMVVWYVKPHTSIKIWLADACSQGAPLPATLDK